MGRLTVAAPAKINLALEVGGVRPDGYHDIHSVMQSIDLRDTIVLEDRPAGISLTCVPADPLEQGAMAHMGSPGRQLPPSDCRNIVWQAAKLLMEATGTERGLHITLRKAIPLSAGLGGGSSDAAAVLRGLNEFWQLGLSVEELMDIGGKIGADVPFCVMGGSAEVRGIGEVVTPLPAAPPWFVILISPSLCVSTAACYREYDKLPEPAIVDVDGVIAALNVKDMRQMSRCLGNSLEAVTFKQLPVVAKLKSTLLECGCEGALMSGSGPTVFGLANSRAHAHKIMLRLDSMFRQELAGEMPNVYLTRFMMRDIS